jgi:hypothetical protein
MIVPAKQGLFDPTVVLQFESLHPYRLRRMRWIQRGAISMQFGQPSVIFFQLKNLDEGARARTYMKN